MAADVLQQTNGKWRIEATVARLVPLVDGGRMALLAPASTTALGPVLVMMPPMAATRIGLRDRIQGCFDLPELGEADEIRAARSLHTGFIDVSEPFLVKAFSAYRAMADLVAARAILACPSPLRAGEALQHVAGGIYEACEAAVRALTTNPDYDRTTDALARLSDRCDEAQGSREDAIKAARGLGEDVNKGQVSDSAVGQAIMLLAPNRSSAQAALDIDHHRLVGPLGADPMAERDHIVGLIRAGSATTAMDDTPLDPAHAAAVATLGDEGDWRHEEASVY